MALEGADGFRDVEVRTGQRDDGRVGLLLHPRLQRVGALEPARVVIVEELHRLEDGRAAQDAVGRLLHLGDDARELFLSPRVRLVQIDGRAEESPRAGHVALASDGLALAGARQQLVPQEGLELHVGVAGQFRAADEFGAQRLGQLAVADLCGARPAAEEAVGADVVGTLLHRDLDLTPCAHVTAVGCVPQRGQVPVDRGGQRGEPLRAGRPVLDGRGRHQVEHVAQRLDGGVDVVEVRLLLAERAQVLVDLEHVVERGHGHPVVGIDRVGRAQRAAGRCPQLGPLLVPVGIECRQRVVVAGQADRGGGDRVVCSGVVEVSVGDRVHCRRGACLVHELAH